MDVVSGSILCQLILALGRLIYVSWDESVPGRVCSAIARQWTRWWHGSALVRFFFLKGGALPRAWPESACCKVLSFLVNLPMALLHKLYVALRPWFSGSFIANLVFGMGTQTAVAAGWLMLVVMNIDYWKWSNGYSFAGFVLLFLLFTAGGMRRRFQRLDLQAVGLYPTVFFVAVCLSWPLSCHPDLSGRYLTYHITCALCVLLVVSAVESARQLERLACFGCLGMAGASAVGIVQGLRGVAVVWSYVDLDLNPDMPGRVFSFYHNPNAFAEMLVMLIPVGVGLFLGAEKKLSRLIGLVSSVMGCLALVMTYCRASWVGLVVAAMVFLFFWNRKLIPMFILVGLACLPLLPKAVFQRVLTIFDSSDSSTNSRFPLIETGLRIIKAHPILGAGLGGDAVRQVSTDLGAYTASHARFTHSHNLYLQIWLEHGLLGFLSFTAGCWHMLKQGAKAFKSPRAPQSTRLIVLGAASALAGSLVSGLADYLFTYPRVMLIFWFSASLLLAGVKLVRNGEWAANPA